MTLEDLVADGWRRHADEPQTVSEALAQGAGLVTSETQLGAYVRLATHLHAEHLDDWRAGVELLESMRLRFEDASRGPYRAATVGIATLFLAGGEAIDLSHLSNVERSAALATAAPAMASRGRLADAVTAYGQALEEAVGGIPAGSPALRALAAAGNNLAVALEQLADRTSAETAAMIHIADAALMYWKRAGGWLEEERAQYRRARTRLQAGMPVEAIECSRLCLQICQKNDAPAFERFFAHAILAIAHRAAGQDAGCEQQRSFALAQHQALSPDELTWCEDEFKELAAKHEAA